MRHSRKSIKKASDRGRRMGKASQDARENDRLQAAMDFRHVDSYLVFEMDTHNPRTGIRHHMEIRHEIENGNDRYNIYMDGERTRKAWSRTAFCKWLFGKIDSVRSDFG